MTKEDALVTIRGIVKLIEEVVEFFCQEEEMPATNKDTPALSPTEAPIVTLEEVRTALGALASSGKNAVVRELLAKHNASRLSEVPPDEYPSLLAEAKNA